MWHFCSGRCPACSCTGRASAESENKCASVWCDVHANSRLTGSLPIVTTWKQMLKSGSCSTKVSRVTISRFCRDRLVFDALGTIILPHAAEKAHARGNEVRCWSAGCASGEEVYSLKIVWEQIANAKSPGASMSILGTDIDETVLRRARTGCYKQSTLREIRPEWLDVCFDRQGDLYCIKDHMREGIRFRMQDVPEFTSFRKI